MSSPSRFTSWNMRTYSSSIRYEPAIHEILVQLYLHLRPASPILRPLRAPSSLGRRTRCCHNLRRTYVSSSSAQMNSFSEHRRRYGCVAAHATHTQADTQSEHRWCSCRKPLSIPVEVARVPQYRGQHHSGSWPNMPRCCLSRKQAVVEGPWCFEVVVERCYEVTED